MGKSKLPSSIMLVYYFALVQRVHFVRSDQINLVSLHLQNLHLPLNPLGLTYHPSFCHSLVPPATLSMSCPLPRLFFHLSLRRCCAPSAVLLLFFLPQCPCSSIFGGSPTPTFMRSRSLYENSFALSSKLSPMLSQIANFKSLPPFHLLGLELIFTCVVVGAEGHCAPSMSIYRI